MPFGEAKVYFDGSHYIAIPHTTRPSFKRPKPPEEKIEISIEDEVENGANSGERVQSEEGLEEVSSVEESVEEKPKRIVQITRKEMFEDLYIKFIDLSRKDRKSKIILLMLPYFKTQKECENFVEENMERKMRNLICKRVRMSRKANLANFNYFCTFTYDNAKHNENTFRKKLMKTLQNFSTRKKWLYMGVWERAPKTQRLHFHGLFHIPKGTMPYRLFSDKDYSFSEHRLQLVWRNSYFDEKFGRSDFKEIQQNEIGQSLGYIMKYIEKTGERVIYSKGLFQYFISDILDEDVVSTIGQEDKKLLLFDDFCCLDQGEYIGNVSPEVIEKMRKCN